MTTDLLEQPPGLTSSTTHGGWEYEAAFGRNLGLISEAEQRRLRSAKIAIVGMGGVGGNHLMTLARLGVGRFSIVDPDSFELANFNRQYGASVLTVGRPKATTMAALARQVNPETQIDIFPTALDESNVGDFLAGCDLVIDGVDFFALAVRRMLFREARRRRLWAITAGPIGFSTAWLSFSPDGMTFDRYFDINESQDRLDQLIAFAVGLAPRATQAAYIDLERVDVSSGVGPSLTLACQLCSAVAAAEALKILLNRGVCRPAPYYAQFDSYRGLLRQGKLAWGNRGPAQRAKRRWLRRYFDRRATR